MNKNILLGLVAIFIVSIASLGLVLAYRGNSDINGPNYNSEVHEQLEVAMDAGNYDEWVKIRKDNNLPLQGRMFQVINAENFDKYVEMHNANLAGDTVKANAIKAELGLGQGVMKKGTGMQQGNMQHSGTGLRQSFVDANNDGLCDTCGNARN